MSHDLHDKRSSDPSEIRPGASRPGTAPGKQTLVEQVQQSTSGPAANDVRAAAARGVAAPSRPLPFGNTIQRAFGAHDVSGVKAHVGPEASASATAMGAHAYATGHHVVLGDRADLHTVAHEAAHVVQQRGGVQLKGGVGAADDEHERQADQVADAVVAGRSAEPLLGDVRAPATGGAAVQRMGKRTREDRDGEDASTDPLQQWLAGPKQDTSYYDESQVHRIAKTDQGMACWNWALHGLQDAGGPTPDVFWSYVLNSARGKQLPPQLEGIPDRVTAQLTQLTRRLAAAKLTGPVPSRGYGSQQQASAKPIMEQMVRTLVELNGLTIVGPGAAAATIVCQYKKKDGAGVPEHWWIELPGGIVLQTVPGQPLEVGDESTRFHDRDGRLHEGARDYEHVRVPIQALRTEQIEVLRAAYEAARANAPSPEPERDAKRQRDHSADRDGGGGGSSAAQVV